MIGFDLLDPLTEVVIIGDVEWLVNLVRWLIFALAILNASLLAKMYHDKQLGRMTKSGKIGAIGIYICVAWAQPIAIQNRSSDLIPLNVAVLVFLMFSLFSIMQLVHFGLFKKGRANA
jgi:cobalamin biosynthesis protein CobD/CbiB